MGSEHMYRSYASVLLGRNARSPMELQEMNLRIKVAKPPNAARTTGYSKYFLQLCTSCVKSQINCIAPVEKASTGTDTTQVGESILFYLRTCFTTVALKY